MKCTIKFIIYICYIVYVTTKKNADDFGTEECQKGTDSVKKGYGQVFSEDVLCAPDVISSMHLDEKSKNLKRKVRVLVHCHLIIVDFNIKFCDRRLPRMH